MHSVKVVQMSSTLCGLRLLNELYVISNGAYGMDLLRAWICLGHKSA